MIDASVLEPIAVDVPAHCVQYKRLGADILG
jgi:hypothetical protein